MPFYKINWLLTLEETDVTKDQLESRLAQKEEEIHHLKKEIARLQKETGEQEDDLSTRVEEAERADDQLKILRERNRIAEEIIGHLDLRSVPPPRFIYDLITDWEQAGMELSR